MYNCLELSRLDFHLPPEEPGPPCPCSEVWSNPTKVVFDLRLVPYPWVIFKLCLELNYRSFYGLLPLLYKLLKFTGGKGSEGSFFFSIFSFFLPCMVFCFIIALATKRKTFLSVIRFFLSLPRLKKKQQVKVFWRRRRRTRPLKIYQMLFSAKVTLKSTRNNFTSWCKAKTIKSSKCFFGFFVDFWFWKLFVTITDKRL